MEESEHEQPDRKMVVFQPGKPYSELTDEEIAAIASMFASQLRQQIAEQQDAPSPPE